MKDHSQPEQGSSLELRDSILCMKKTNFLQSQKAEKVLWQCAVKKQHDPSLWLPVGGRRMWRVIGFAAMKRRDASSQVRALQAELAFWRSS